MLQIAPGTTLTIEWLEGAFSGTVEEALLRLEGLHDRLLEGGLGARFVSHFPKDMSAIPERAVFIRERITQTEALAVFAGGLEVKTSACFSAPDATTGIASYLIAPCVVSGNGDGWASLWDAPKANVDMLVGWMEGAGRQFETRTL